MKNKAYKYELKVTVTLQSDNYARLQSVANKYYNPIIPLNNPKDKSNYVAINSVKEGVKSNEPSRTD